MGARRGFRVVLYAENWLGTVTQAFDGSVVEIDAINFNFLRKCCGIHGKTVVLGCDLNVARFQIHNRLIGPAMAKLELECTAAQRLPKDLVPETNAKHRRSMSY